MHDGFRPTKKYQKYQTKRYQGHGIKVSNPQNTRYHEVSRPTKTKGIKRVSNSIKLVSLIFLLKHNRSGNARHLLIFLLKPFPQRPAAFCVRKAVPCADDKAVACRDACLLADAARVHHRAEQGPGVPSCVAQPRGGHKNCGAMVEIVI